MKTGKYKIIREYDDNGTRHYELWFEHHTWFGRTKWKPVISYGFRHSYTRRFESPEEVQHYINSLNENREIVETGVLL